jgi:hypothetical protein
VKERDRVKESERDFTSVTTDDATFCVSSSICDSSAGAASTALSG